MLLCNPGHTKVSCVPIISLWYFFARDIMSIHEKYNQPQNREKIPRRNEVGSPPNRQTDRTSDSGGRKNTKPQKHGRSLLSNHTKAHSTLKKHSWPDIDPELTILTHQAYPTTGKCCQWLRWTNSRARCHRSSSHRMQGCKTNAHEIIEVRKGSSNINQQQT